MTTATASRRNGAGKTVLPLATRRVAIYTRKSTDEGLDQEFNSLDAQRAAVEAYLQSQRGEGWVALPERYDDGGYSGANTDRPGFKRLLADVEAGRVNIVAVYKIDRLSRSLVDFARVMDFFEAHEVTFVSITQQFNSTTSMGRLTLNILMSFAEFERQVISERTRDKIGATRKKGLWTGGRIMLGYKVEEKRLVVVPEEAEQVRTIYRIFLETGTVVGTVGELQHRGWLTKAGKPYDKCTLYRLLKSAVYLGKVRYRGELYDAPHEAIVDLKTWQAAQHLLKHPCAPSKTFRSRSGAILAGILRCGSCGSAMSPHFASKHGKRWGSYVCQRMQKCGKDACPGSRVSQPVVEQFVVDRIREVGRDPKVFRKTIEATKKALEKRKTEAAGELKSLDSEVEKRTRERTNLLDAVAAGGPRNPALLTRLSEVEEAYGKATERAAALRGELAALEGQVVDEKDLKAALASFDPVWDQLFPAEKARVLRLLIEEVRYHAKDGEIEMTFRPGGVRAMAEEATA